MIVRLTYNQVVTLHDAHLWKEFSAADPHTMLLIEHCRSFTELFERLLDKGCRTNKVKFSRLQALAFIQLWTGQELPRTAAAVAILDILEMFDQAKHAAKLLQC